MSAVRIVPGRGADGGVSTAQGTKVYTSDGHEISGITEITLRAEVNGLWRATIVCFASVDELLADAEILHGRSTSASSAIDTAKLNTSTAGDG